MKRSHLYLEWTHLARHKALFAVALLWRGVWEIVPMQVPLLAGALVDGLSGKGLRLLGFHWPEAGAEQVLLVTVTGLVMVAVVYGISAYAYTVAGALLDKKFVASLRKAVIQKIMLLSLEQHQSHGNGELLDSALRHTDRLRGFTERVFTRSITNTVRAIYPVCMLFFINPVLALIVLAVVPPQWLAVWYLQKRLHAATRASLKSHSNLTTAIGENLDGVETLKALNAGNAAVVRLHEDVEQVETDEVATDRITARIRCVTWFMTSIGIALIWWQGGLRVLDGDMTLGMLVSFTGFAEFAYRPFRLFTNIVKTYRVSLASLERIQELLDAPPELRDRDNARSLDITGGKIEFRSVSFAYRSKNVLLGVNLEIEGGRFTAIVGPNGSGKSTLLRLIARLFEPRHGQVQIDGQALADCTRESLYCQLAVVPQRPTLFSGTILENLRLARPDASQQEIQAACAAASALPIIERLEKGFDTILGRHGVHLSAGEAQRIAIARTLLNRPRILLMDEPTSAMDADSEAALVNTLLTLRARMTIVLVTHCPQTVRRADRIIVLDAGRVVAEGTHEELLLQSPFYVSLSRALEPNNAEALELIDG